MDALPKKILNPSFEEGALGKVPSGWFLPQAATDAGYSAKLTEDMPHAGKRCAVIERTLNAAGMGFGNLMQTFDAADYRGKRICYRAAVRADGRA
jgi:hypothetical protein